MLQKTIAISLLVMFVCCKSDEKNSDIPTTTENKDSIILEAQNQRKEALSIKYNCTTILNSDSTNSLYTFKLKEILDSSNHNIIISNFYIRDIEKYDTTYKITILGKLEFYELTANKTQLYQLLKFAKHPFESVENCYVIAYVTDISKRNLPIESDGTKNYTVLDIIENDVKKGLLFKGKILDIVN